MRLSEIQNSREEMLRLAGLEVGYDVRMPSLGPNSELIMDWAIKTVNEFDDVASISNVVYALKNASIMSDIKSDFGKKNQGSDKYLYWESMSRYTLEQIGWHKLQPIQKDYAIAEGSFDKLPRSVIQFAERCRWAIEYLDLLKEIASQSLADPYPISVAKSVLKKLSCA